MKAAMTAALCAALTLAAGGAAAQEAQTRLAAKAEACIAGHAAEVARAEPNLAAAVDVLVGDLCAPEIELVQRYEASSRMLGLLRSQQQTSVQRTTAPPPVPAEPPGVQVVQPQGAAPSPAVAAMAAMRERERQSQEAKLAELQQARVSPETGEIEGLPPSQAGMFSVVSLALDQLRPNRSPARYRAAAARAVLSARAGR
ncbi:MAG TPA: hypothetical protein VGH15_00070 [Caulobacteraceae bacterium]|jgi:hypothetical protein